MIPKSITSALMASFAVLRSHKTFLIPKVVLDTISHWTSCCTIQGVLVLVISNRSRGSSSSDFENYLQLSSFKLFARLLALNCTPLDLITITVVLFD